MSKQDSHNDRGSDWRPLDWKDGQSNHATNEDKKTSDHGFSEENYKPPVDYGPLKHVNWGATPLGEIRSWPPSLKSLASVLVNIPYAAAIFWGHDLITIHNSPWSFISGSNSDQGKRASELFSPDAVGRLRATMAGQTLDTDSENFFQDHGQDVQNWQTLVHPLCGDGSTIAGVMAQFINSRDAGARSLWKKHEKGHSHEKEAAGLMKWLRDTGNTDNSSLQPKEGSPMNQDADNQDADNTSDESFTALNQGERTDSMGTSLQDLPIDGRVLFEKFANMIPTGLAILDSDADALFVNDLFYKLTSHQPGANPFRSWPQSIHPDDYDRVMDEYKNAFHSAQILSTQFRSAGPGDYDSPSWRMFMMRPISDAVPVAQDGYICAIIDITSLKAAELYQARIASEAIERKKQQEKFMDMISHEIRNPLSAILHCSEGIIESIKGSPEGAGAIDAKGMPSKDHIVDQACLADILEAADTILFCVAHQKNIVDDILSISKLDAMMLSLSPAPFQPDQKFAQYLRIFQPELRQKGITIHFAIDPSYPDAGVDWVNADMVRMNQVLVNLMTNAIKFTARKNGERNITVSLGASIQRPTSYPPSVVFFQDEDAASRMDATLGPEWSQDRIVYLLIAVRDTGIGISDADQAKLFERFRQATPKTQEQYGGSGLGLFISRKLCQLHGGDIGVSSKDGEGSTFGFFFKVRRIDKPEQRDIDKQEANMQNSTLMPHDLPVDKSTPESLVSPPIEDRKEVHPAASSDERYERSAKIAAQVDQKMNEKSELREQEQSKVEERERPGTSDKIKTPGELETPVRSSSSDSGLTQHKSGTAHDDGYISGQDAKKTTSVSNFESSKIQIDDKPGLSGDPPQPSPNPAPEAISGNQQSPKDIKPRTSPPPHVLLVEDNIVNQRVLKRHLQAKGFRVTTANNGKQAVEAHEARLDDQEKKDDRADEGESRATDAGQFDCILMDQEMPVMDGNTATKTIRKHENQRWGDAKRNRVPVLGISANARDVQRAGMLSAGMDDVMSKPFSMADLVRQVHGMIERGQTARRHNEPESG